VHSLLISTVAGDSRTQPITVLSSHGFSLCLKRKEKNKGAKERKEIAAG
jgi:hypothetical protein